MSRNSTDLSHTISFLFISSRKRSPSSWFSILNVKRAVRDTAKPPRKVNSVVKTLTRRRPKMDIRLLVSLFLVAFPHQYTNAENLKLCVVENVNTAKRINSLCPQLVTTGTQVECVIGNDRINCLRQLTTGQADLTVLEPEDLFAATAYNEYNVLVTNELRLFPDEKQRFEMVVLVNKDVKSIWDVKGKRFCHPGFDMADDWTKSFSTYFEKWIIPKECDPQKTLLENRVIGLSNFFEAACIPGPWVADVTYSMKLKSHHHSLCASCDSPLGCFTSDKYHGREGALLCITDNAGDIAWVRLDDTRQHFESQHIDKENYNYLCPDGTTRPMKLDKPCVWITRPWPVIVARREVAEKVEKMMRDMMKQRSNWVLRDLLENYHPSPVSTDTLETPEDFLLRFPGFISANNRASCRPSRRVRWCIASNLEDRKCRWLREASFVYGLEPAISCVQELTRAACMRAIAMSHADVFVARPEEMFDARRMGLKPVVQAIPKKLNNYNRVVAVVKQDSSFRSIKDLKGAKACFTGYRGVGWNTFVAILKNISGSNVQCSDVNAVANFFAESCVPDLNESHEEVPYNLYSLCKQTSKSRDDLEALNCLSSGLGDVAFVNLKNVEKKIGNLDSRNRNDRSNNLSYRTLCVNETEVDEENPCFLAWSPLSTVVIQENLTDVRRDDIYMMLVEMDDLFGGVKAKTSAFSLYGPYDSNHSVIFPEETKYLHAPFNLQQMRIPSYNDMIDDLVASRVSCSGVKSFSPYYYNMIFIYIIFYILSISLSA